MQRKLKQIINLLLIVVTFFSTSIVVNAKQGYAGYVLPKLYDGVVYYMNGVKGSNNTDYRSMGVVGIYHVNDQHAYCIEPGTIMNSTGYAVNNGIKLENYDYGKFTTPQKRTMLSQILTFAENIGTVPSTWNKDTKNDQIRRAFAAQGLIWEVATGERTSFNAIKPTNHQGTKCSYYDVLHAVNGCNKTDKGKALDFTVVKNEYDRIVTAIQKTFMKYPGETKKQFKPSGSEDKVALSWDSKTKKYTVVIKDADFSYWEISEKSGLEVTKTNNSITISSSAPIEEANAKVVSIKIINKNKSANSTGPIAFYSKDYQDVSTIVGTTLERFIKVYTPKYQLKIVKKASLDNTKLEGVKFNICSNSSCSTVLTTVTTDKNGEAVYTNVAAPGTYYVKETATKSGYTLDSTPKAVTVSSANIASTSSYGTITITNANKIFNLTKKTIDEDGNIVDLEDGCGTDSYTGPEFEIKENGNSLYFKEIKPGEYDTSTKDVEGATTKLKTCKGKFKVYTLPNCNYTISETKAPDGLTLPSEPTKSINVCGADKNVSFTNGFAGLEFQKKDENGNFVVGGKFSIQQKVNNIYKDILLKELDKGNYIYDANLTEKDASATYIILTNEGIAHISKLAPGEYRIVEKEAPNGYEKIEDKDSKAIVTVKDSDKEDYYLVEMIDRKSSKNGSSSSAELVVTITTGRKVPNYIFIISSLAILLVIVIILRKKMKK